MFLQETFEILQKQNRVAFVFIVRVSVCWIVCLIVYREGLSVLRGINTRDAEQNSNEMSTTQKISNTIVIYLAIRAQHDASSFVLVKQNRMQLKTFQIAKKIRI